MKIFTVRPASVFYVTTDIPFNAGKKALTALNDIRLCQIQPSTPMTNTKCCGLLVGAKDEIHARSVVEDLCSLAGITSAITSNAGWQSAVWFGTDDPEITKEFDCYMLPYKPRHNRRGKIWLRVCKHEYMNKTVKYSNAPGARSAVVNTRKYEYTSSFGANSENSFSGSLPVKMNNLSLQAAQLAVLLEIQRINRW